MTKNSTAKKSVTSRKSARNDRKGGLKVRSGTVAGGMSVQHNRMTSQD